MYLLLHIQRNIYNGVVCAVSRAFVTRTQRNKKDCIERGGTQPSAHSAHQNAHVVVVVGVATLVHRAHIKSWLPYIHNNISSTATNKVLFIRIRDVREIVL